MSKIKGKKNKKTIFAIGALALLIALVGGVVAYNSDLSQFNNKFDLGLYRTEVSEVFDSPTGWKPCDNTEKLVTVKNSGTVDVDVRIKMNEAWTSASGDELDLIRDGMTLAQIEFANDDWELRDGFYYLKNSLRAGSSVQFIKAVKFNCDADFGENEMIGGDGKVVSKVENEYNGATYHLDLKAQMMAADSGAEWRDVFDDYVEPRTFAKLQSGMGATIKDIYGENTVKAFKRSGVLPAAASVTNMTPVNMEGETPIYMWYSGDDQTVYWYSAADAISWNGSDSIGGIFDGYWFNSKLDDISGFTYFDMRALTGLGGFFWGNDLPDDMSPVSHWNLEGITSLSGVFTGGCSSTTDGSCYFKAKHHSAVEYWKLPNLVYMQGVFTGNDEITDFNFVSKWDVSNVQYMDSLANNLKNLESLNGLEKWNTSNVVSAATAFAEAPKLTDISAIKKWNMANNRALYHMFYNSSNLDSLEALRNWNTSSVTSMEGMFYNTKISDVCPIEGWNVANVTNFKEAFYYTRIDSATCLNGWSVSDTATLSYMFYGTNINNDSNYPSWYTSGRRY